MQIKSVEVISVRKGREDEPRKYFMNISVNYVYGVDLKNRTYHIFTDGDDLDDLESAIRDFIFQREAIEFEEKHVKALMNARLEERYREPEPVRADKKAAE